MHDEWERRAITAPGPFRLMFVAQGTREDILEELRRCLVTLAGAEDDDDFSVCNAGGMYADWEISPNPLALKAEIVAHEGDATINGS